MIRHTMMYVLSQILFWPTARANDTVVLQFQKTLG